MSDSVQARSKLFYGYGIVVVSFCLQACGWGIFNSFGVFVNPLMETFAWPKAAVAAGYSGSLLISGVFAMVMGRISDRFGPRVIMTVCGLIMGAGFLCLYRLQGLWQFFVFYCVLIGVGISGTDVVLLSTTARWFVQRRGTMSGLLKVGTGLGMLFFPLLIIWLITHFGWRTAFFVLGLLVLGVYTLLSQFLVRDPGLRGLYPDNASPRAGGAEHSHESGLSLGRASSSRSMWTICLVYFLILFCVGTVLVHIVPHVISLGFSAVFAAQIVSIIGGMSIAGRFVMGWAGDRLGNTRALVYCFLVLLSGLSLLIAAEHPWLLICFAVLHGFAHGGFFAIISPIVAQFFGTLAHGSILGIVIFSSTLGGAVGPVLGGGLADVWGGYRLVFAGLAGTGLLGLVLTLTLRPVSREGDLSLWKRPQPPR